MVYLDARDRKMALLRVGMAAVRLEQCGAPLDRRFTFYDQAGWRCGCRFDWFSYYCYCYCYSIIYIIYIYIYIYYYYYYYYYYYQFSLFLLLRFLCLY